MLAGVAWWVRRRELTVPVALGACAVLYLVSIPSSGDYSQAKALMIAAPLAMLVAIRPLLTELGGRRASDVQMADAPGPSARRFGAGCAGRLGRAGGGLRRRGPCTRASWLCGRRRSGRPGTGRSCRHSCRSCTASPCSTPGQDRYAAYDLLGADTHVPLVEFPDAEVSPNPEKPFDTGDAYSPIDFDSFSRGTLNRFAYVITGRAAWNSQAPPNFGRIAATPSYVLWKRTGPTPENRHVLLEGTEAGALAGCAAPEVRILLASGGRASLFPGAVIGPKAAWDGGSVLGTGATTSQPLDLPAGSWNLSVQYFSPFDLTLSAPGFESR